MADVVILVILLALVIGLIRSMTRKGRYTGMSEEEFEKEAERVTLRGAGVAEYQRIVDPSHKVEYLQQRDKHVEAEESDSGDKRKSGARQRVGEEEHDPPNHP